MGRDRLTLGTRDATAERRWVAGVAGSAPGVATGAALVSGGRGVLGFPA